MDLPLTEKGKELFDLLMQIPPKFEEAEELIKSQKYAKEELTKVAINYADECFVNVNDALLSAKGNSVLLDERIIKINSRGVAEGFHSTYLYEVLELLLRYGIDVNAIFYIGTSCYNLMSSVMWVDNGFVAADSMKLLLENGGNPNLMLDEGSLYDEFSFDIFFGALEQSARWHYKSWVHTWFVLLAFGGEHKGGCLFKEYNADEESINGKLFSLEKLRDHRNYDFCLSWGKDGADVHIFDKKTFWEVARF